MKRYIVMIMLVITAMVLVACGDKDEKEAKESENTDALNPSVEISDKEKVADDKVVAVINGTEVTGDVYNLVYSQLKLHSTQLKEEVDLEEVKDATMESIIDREIVFQEAKEEGIDITKETAETEFDTLKKENGKELETLLQQYQITEEGFKEQLRFELTMNEYLTKAIKVEVSDEEVKEAYDEAKAEADKEDQEIPEFDEVKDQIKGNMREEKVTLALQEKVDKVKETAEIERKI